MLISIEQLDESARRYAALTPEEARTEPEKFTDELLPAGVAPQAVSGNIVSKEENIAKRREMLVEENKEPFDFALERAIGNNDSVYSNFVELIRSAKRKVGRVAVKKGPAVTGYATGFMVTDRLLLTNWHVFRTIDAVANSEVQFFYEYDIMGNPMAATVFNFDPNSFFYSNKELDYCFVAVNPVDVTGSSRLSAIGYLKINPGLGKIGNENEEALNIIHHPDGDFKQLSIRENIFRKITPTSIYYTTDTATGSSGSPVFNDQWQVVALHHSGVGQKNAAGQYTDKDGNVVEPVNGKINAAKLVWIANEGIRASVLLKDVQARFPGNPFINALDSEPPAAESDESFEPDTTIPSINKTTPTMAQNNPGSDVQIVFPASLIQSNGYININISNAVQSIAPKQPEAAPTPVNGSELLEEELKKLEEETDFSGCKGYQSRFLGTGLDIALPQPKTPLMKFIAKLDGTDGITLKYYNYSTIFHAVRMMPVISAINVDGDANKRQDREARKDNWLRDKRLSFDIQLDDTWYKKSGFDRGHMSRREDANWGATAEDAKRNADLTCMYTNACPQVAKLNQGGKKGLWGILEKVVLESGAEVEGVSTRKISVFNGPVFKDNDPVYKGIQVPMDFYKIVLWLTDDRHLKATAFKLSQINFVDDIDFEQLDLDQNTEFKEYQVSIKSLSAETNIDFKDIEPFDTFNSNDGQPLEITSVTEVAKHIAAAKIGMANNNSGYHQ